MKIYGKNVVSSNQLYDGVMVSGWMPNRNPRGGNDSTGTDSLDNVGLIKSTDYNYAAVIPFDVEYFLSGHSLFIWSNSSYCRTLGYAICTDLNPTSIASDIEYKTNIAGLINYISNSDTSYQISPLQIPYNNAAIKAVIEGYSTAYLLVFSSISSNAPLSKGGEIKEESKEEETKGNELRATITQSWRPVVPGDIKVAWSNNKPNDTYATTFTSGWFKADQNKDIVVDGTGFFNAIGAESIYLEGGNWYNRAQTNQKMRINTAQARVDKNNNYGYYSACFQIPTDAVGKTFCMYVPQFEIMENDPQYPVAIITATDPTQNTSYHYGEILSIDWNGMANLATLTATDDIAGKFVTFQTKCNYHGSIIDYNDCYTQYIAGSSDSDCLRVGNTESDVSVVKPYVPTPGWNKNT
jgi:hypothetical protein